MKRRQLSSSAGSSSQKPPSNPHRHSSIIPGKTSPVVHKSSLNVQQPSTTAKKPPNRRSPAAEMHSDTKSKSLMDGKRAATSGISIPDCVLQFPSLPPHPPLPTTSTSSTISSLLGSISLKSITSNSVTTGDMKMKLQPTKSHTNQGRWGAMIFYFL